MKFSFGEDWYLQSTPPLQKHQNRITVLVNFSPPPHFEVSKKFFLYLGEFRFCECAWKTRFPPYKSLAGAFFGVFYIPVGLGSFSECFVYDFSLQGRFWDFLHKTVGIFRKSPNVQRKSPTFSEEITTFSEFHRGNHHRIKKKHPKFDDFLTETVKIWWFSWFWR